MEKDFSLKSGERQTGTEIHHIREDHLIRYYWVKDRLKNKGVSKGLDVFCGNGYGSYILSDLCNIVAIDGSEEAVNLAKEHYSNANTEFINDIFPFSKEIGDQFDFICSLESIEHVEDDLSFFFMLVDKLKIGGDLFLSTPNERHMPLDHSPHKFHFKHYYPEEVISMASQKGLRLIEIKGQNIYEEVSKTHVKIDERKDWDLKQTDGQFTIYHFKKEEQPVDIFGKNNSITDWIDQIREYFIKEQNKIIEEITVEKKQRAIERQQNHIEKEKWHKEKESLLLEQGRLVSEKENLLLEQKRLVSENNHKQQSINLLRKKANKRMKRVRILSFVSMILVLFSTILLCRQIF